MAAVHQIIPMVYGRHFVCSWVHYRAGVQLEKFECEWVDWTLFKQDEEVFAGMKNAISNLKELGLLLRIFHHEECGEYLATTERFQEFVGSAAYLVTLNICFNPEPYCLITLEHIVGQLHWPHLEHIGCEAITATEDKPSRLSAQTC